MRTVTWKSYCAVLPAASVEVHFTCVRPIGIIDIGAGLHSAGKRPVDGVIGRGWRERHPCRSSHPRGRRRRCGAVATTGATDRSVCPVVVEDRHQIAALDEAIRNGVKGIDRHREVLGRARRCASSSIGMRTSTVVWPSATSIMNGVVETTLPSGAVDRGGVRRHDERSRRCSTTVGVAAMPRRPRSRSAGR